MHSRTNSITIVAILLLVCICQTGVSGTLELIVSDSGRNQAWSHGLRIGDSFSVKGADGNPVGGVMLGTSAIQQVLVPMPGETEITSDLRSTKQNWTRETTEMLKDRVHIATTNGVSLFEIRLLQHTPKPAAENLPWKDNTDTQRFGKWAYESIGNLVSHLNQMGQPVRITADLADSGCAAFAAAIDQWKPYADTFRRVDMIDGRSTLSQIRPVISELDNKRVRLFITEGSRAAPMSIGQISAAKSLLNKFPGTMLYSMQAGQTDTSTAVQSMPWQKSLTGLEPYSVTRYRVSNNQIIEQKLDTKLTAQNFRDPITGWDPTDIDMEQSASLKQLGVVAPTQDQTALPVISEMAKSGSSIVSQSSESKPVITIHMYDMGIRQHYTEDLEIGDPFAKGDYPDGHNNVRDEFTIEQTKHVGQFISPMPPNNKMDAMTDQELEMHYYKGLLGGVNKQILDGKSAIEIQRIQNIGRSSLPEIVEIVPGFKGTLIDKKQQDRVERCVKAEAKAFVRVVGHFEKNCGIQSKIFLTGASNGAKFIVYGSDSLSQLGPRVVHVGIVNGKAKIAPVIEAIQKYGARKVSLEATHDDYEDTPYSGISYLGTLKKIGKECPGTTIVYTVPTENKVFGTNHVARLADPERPFKVVKILKIKEGLFGTKRATFTNIVSDKRQKMSGQNITRMLNGPEYDVFMKPLNSKAESGHLSLSRSSQKQSYNLNTRTIEIPQNRMDRIVPRIGHGTNLVLRGRTVLDKYNFNKLNDNSVSISRDPLRFKTPGSNDLVIEPKQNFKYTSMNTRLENLESNFELRAFTRNQTARPFSMQEGFNKWEDNVIGDIPDLQRYSLSSSPLKARPEVDGVMLSAPAKVEGGGSTLSSGNVSLIFQNSSGVIDFMKLKRFATALWCTYLSVEGPGISIEPINKGLQTRKDKHEVRYIGQVRNTELGMVMRETDYLMKRWSVGSHRPDVSNFLTPDQLRKAAKKKASERPSRFWLVPDNLTFNQSDNMLLLSSGRMTVQTEYLDNNPTGEKNEINEMFANWLTNNYDEVSYRYPVFGQLFEYSKLVGLSTYLRENRIPMMWFLLANRELVITERSIDMVDQLSKKSGHEFWVTAYGGVEMQLNKTIQNKKNYKFDKSLADAETKILTDQSDKNKPVIFSANDTFYTVASKNTLKLFSTPAEGDTIQTDLGLVDEYSEKLPGSNIQGWQLVAPRIELIRYYNPKLKTRAQFGTGWHLLVPFRLETEAGDSLSGLRSIPEKLVMANLLSGVREVLRRDKKSTGRLRYVSSDKSGLTENLELNSNNIWILKDKLGAEFAFDKDGDLRKMVLRGDKEIKYKLNNKAYPKFIPGYSVEYSYDNKRIEGRETKVLTAIKQGSHTARVDWQPDTSIPQIAGIRVLQKGKVKPVENLNYEYGNDGMLAQVRTQGGQRIEIQYEANNNMVTVASK